MSLLTVVYVPEGIVLAGDSRLTMTYETKEGDVSFKHNVIASDFNHKVFLLKDKIGLGTFGAAAINGIPIAGYISKFTEEKINEQIEVDKVPDVLVDYFGEPFGFPSVSFYVIGYKIENGISLPYVYYVNIGTKTIDRNNPPERPFGANWGGEIEVLSRLLNKVQQIQGSNTIEFPDAPIPWWSFTLQDAIDFSIYAIRTTKETFRFQNRPKTVGGPIDILAIKPQEKPIWVAKKEYRANY